MFMRIRPFSVWKDANSRRRGGYAERGVQEFTCHQPSSGKANFVSSSFHGRSSPHVHVSHPDGEAKFWLSPTVELARNIGLSSQRIKEAERLVETRQKEIIDAWNNHFGG